MMVFRVFLPLYIDPGTGSLLFSLLITLATTLTFGARALFLKARLVLSGGRRPAREDGSPSSVVIFSDHKRYWNVFGPICDEFERRKVPLVFYTASADDPALSARYEFVRAEFLGGGNRPYVRLNALSADVVLSTTPHLGVFQWKRSRSVGEYVHIPHTVDELAGYRMFSMDYYDAVLTTGRNQEELIRRLEAARPNTRRKELVRVGSVPLDGLMRKLGARPAPAGGGDGEVVVLLAPSWGEGALLSRCGERLLSALVGTGFRIIVRPHPQTVASEQRVLRPLRERFRSVEWNFDNDNFEVLRESSVLVTDFSGIIFDYALVFGKPFLYAEASFDPLPYEADWIGGTRWCFRAAERMGVRLSEDDFGRMREVLEGALHDGRLSAARAEVGAECWDHRGESAARAADWLISRAAALAARRAGGG